MTVEEAAALMRTRSDSRPPVVTITRGGGRWAGKPVGLVTQPSMILDVDGKRIVIAIDGAQLAQIDLPSAPGSWF